MVIFHELRVMSPRLVSEGITESEEISLILGDFHDAEASSFLSRVVKCATKVWCGGRFAFWGGVHGLAMGCGWPVMAVSAVATSWRLALMYVVVAGPVVSVCPA
jgi:hypothetical protein